MTMTITEKVAYLKGLADGLELDKEPTKEGKLIAKIIDILEDVGLAVEDLEEEVEELEDEMEDLEEDLSDLETLLLEDDDEDDDDDILPFGCCGGSCFDDEDDSFEIECPSCGEDVVIDESVLDKGEVVCTNCGDKFQLELFDSEEDDEEEKD